MIIHHLKVSGFKIMGEQADISFPDKGRIAILGPNESGKTTLFQAIEFALYGLKKGSAPEADRENVITWGKSGSKLEIEFTSGTNRYNLQREFNSKTLHKATLTPIINGFKDKSSAITNLRTVEEKITQITGMDRDAFGKLVYIKQKDLDALRDLAKGKREQLVNKVMGIELFDDAASRVKEDTAQLERELKIKQVELDQVRKNKIEYESKVAQKNALDDQIIAHKKELKGKETTLNEAKALLEKYNWLFNVGSAKETQAALNEQKTQVEGDLTKLHQLEEETAKISATLSKYRPQVLDLQSLHDRLLDLEGRLTRAQGLSTELLNQKSSLDAQDIEQHIKLEKKEAALNDAKVNLTKYDWLNTLNAAKEMEASIESQKAGVEKDLERLSSLEQDAAKLGTAKEKYEPEISRLQPLHSQILELEKQAAQAEDSINALQSQKQATIESLGLSGDSKLLSQSIVVQKRKKLTMSGVMLVAGIACLLPAFLLASLIAIGGGLALVVIAAYVFSQYLRLDKLATQSSAIEALNLQLEQEKGRFEQIQAKKQEVLAQSPYKSSADIQNRLSAITQLMKQETGESSVEGIAALLRSTEANIRTLKLADLQSKKNALSGQLLSKQIEITLLNEHKPALVEQIAYSKEQHLHAQQQLNNAQSEFDKLNLAISNSAGTIKTLSEQIQGQQEEIERLQAAMAKIKSQSKLEGSEDAKNQLAHISGLLTREVGESSIEGVEALLRSRNGELKSLRASDLQFKKASIETQILAKQAEIDALEKAKPADIEKLSYSKKQHEAAKVAVQKSQDEFNSINQTLSNNIGKLQPIEKDIQRLQADFDTYPGLEQKVATSTEQVALLKRINFELSETSKELRNKVIPHARFIINQILPTLTNGRYSDFEITEDLKFKVHSIEAGGYKEREIFSGGTQDQFLIALRLAFTQSILDSRVMADKYSLLMDECTSSSDDLRKQGIFEVLDTTKQTFAQIFVIAHEDIATFVDNNLVLDRNEHGYTMVRSKSW